MSQCYPHTEAEKDGADGITYIVCTSCGGTLRKKQPERLAAAAIRRNGKIESRGFKTHSDIRGALGDEDAYESKRADEEGFLTDGGRFVDRFEAAAIGYAVGQVRDPGARLLSSEVTWDAKPTTGVPTKRKLYGKQPKRLFRV